MSDPASDPGGEPTPAEDNKQVDHRGTTRFQRLARGEREQRPAEDDAEAKPAQRRRPRLLAPVLQLKLGIYTLFMAFSFAGGLIGMLHTRWSRFRSSLREFTTISDTQYDALMTSGQIQDTITSMVLITVLFIVINLVVVAIFTHRLLGPAKAFRRHVDALIAGDYSVRTHLRKHDAFQEVAEDLNRLAEAFENKHSSGGSA